MSPPDQVSPPSESPRRLAPFDQADPAPAAEDRQVTGEFSGLTLQSVFQPIFFVVLPVIESTSSCCYLWTLPSLFTNAMTVWPSKPTPGSRTIPAAIASASRAAMASKTSDSPVISR